MEELALKPAESVPTNVDYNALDSNSVVRSVLTYNYGEDIIKWGAIRPFTPQHRVASPMLNMFDGIASTSYQLEQLAAASETTEFVIDFGKLLEIRGIIVSGEVHGGNLNCTFLTSSYSIDGINYIQFGSQGNDSGQPNRVTYFDHILATNRIRSIKINLTSGNLGSGGNIYQVMTIV